MNSERGKTQSLPHRSEPATTGILLPCFNEAEGLRFLIPEILKTGLREIVVVDDGSNDSTASVGRQNGAMCIQLPTNSGKGAAIRSGLSWALDQGWDWAILMDGDGQHSPKDLHLFVDAIKEADSQCALIVGNRMWDKGSMPRVRRYTNQFMSWLISLRCHQSMVDTQCGYRAVRLSVWSQIQWTQNHYQIESELISKMANAGHAIHFIKIRTLYLTQSGQRFTSKIKPILDGWRWLKWFLKEFPNQR